MKPRRLLVLALPLLWVGTLTLGRGSYLLQAPRARSVRRARVAQFAARPARDGMGTTAARAERVVYARVRGACRQCAAEDVDSRTRQRAHRQAMSVWISTHHASKPAGPAAAFHSGAADSRSCGARRTCRGPAAHGSWLSDRTGRCPLFTGRGNHRAPRHDYRSLR